MFRLFCTLAFLLLASSGIRAQPKTASYRTVLIHAGKNINVGNFERDAKNVTPDCPHPWSIQLTTLRGGKQEGVQLLEIHNGKMHIVLIPTRGMGILSVTAADDLKLGWKSPVTEVVHPRHVNLQLRGGLGWLEGFNEWLARCGLENTGQAGQDEIINNVGDKQIVELTLHGKIANIPASEVEIDIERKPPYRITVRGVVHEKMLFGPKLELVTVLSTEPGSDQFRIEDTVINRGSQPQEYQILYHYNFGKPLLGDGAKLHVPVERVTPYNLNAARDIKTWNSFAAPKPGYVEQVYLMRPLDDKEGQVHVLLHNHKADRGVVLQYPKKALPFLTLWKNTGADEDGYVIGIEPGVSFPNARRVERAAGRVPKLAGGASHTMRMDFTLLSTKATVEQAVARISAVQKTKAPIIDPAPEGQKGAKIDKAKAATIALRHGNRVLSSPKGDSELVIHDKFCEETNQGWLIYLTTKAYLETGDVLKGIAIGFGPILVLNDTGEVYQFSTAYGRDEIIKMLNARATPWNK